MIKLGLILQLIFWFMPTLKSETANSNILFELGRSKDQNKIFYEVNLNDRGELNHDSPFKIYWKKGSRKESLSYIQQNYAYGLKMDESNKGALYFHFVSYPARKLKLSKMDGRNEYKVYINHLNKWVVLKEIFIQIDGGSFWFPKITNVNLSLMEPQTCVLIKENIIPH